MHGTIEEKTEMKSNEGWKLGLPLHIPFCRHCKPRAATFDCRLHHWKHSTWVFSKALYAHTGSSDWYAVCAKHTQTTHQPNQEWRCWVHLSRSGTHTCPHPVYWTSQPPHNTHVSSAAADQSHSSKHHQVLHCPTRCIEVLNERRTVQGWPGISLQ